MIIYLIGGIILGMIPFYIQWAENTVLKKENKKLKEEIKTLRGA